MGISYLGYGRQLCAHNACFENALTLVDMVLRDHFQAGDN